MSLAFHHVMNVQNHSKRRQERNHSRASNRPSKETEQPKYGRQPHVAFHKSKYDVRELRKTFNAVNMNKKQRKEKKQQEQKQELRQSLRSSKSRRSNHEAGARAASVLSHSSSNPTLTRDNLQQFEAGNSRPQSAASQRSHRSHRSKASSIRSGNLPYQKRQLSDDYKAKLQRIYEREQKKDLLTTKFVQQEGRRSMRSTHKQQQQQQQQQQQPAQKYSRPPTAQSIRNDAMSEAGEERPVSRQSARPSTAASSDMFAFDPEPRRSKMAMREQTLCLDDPEGPNWLKIMEHHNREDQLALKAEGDFRKTVQQQYKQDLANQIAEREEQRKLEDVEKIHARTRFHNLHKQWEAEEQIALSKRAQEVLRIKEMREEQVAEMAARRAQMQKKNRYMESRERVKIERELDIEVQEKQAARGAKRAEMAQQDQLNALHRRQKAEAEFREQQEDIRRQEAYAAEVEKNERERAEHYARLQKVREYKLKQLNEFTKSDRELEREAEERASRELEKRQTQREAQHMAREEARVALQRHTNLVIAKQILEKKERMLREMEDDHDYGMRVHKDAETHVQEEKERAHIERKKLKELQRMLDEQKAEDRRLRLAERSVMSEHERNINNQLLRRVANGSRAPSVQEMDIKTLNNPWAKRTTSRLM